MSKILFIFILCFCSAAFAQMEFNEELSIYHLPEGTTFTFQQDVLIPPYEGLVNLLTNTDGTRCSVALKSTYSVIKYIPKGYVVTLSKVEPFGDAHLFKFQEGTQLASMLCFNMTRTFSPTIKEIKILLNGHLLLTIPQPEPI